MWLANCMQRTNAFQWIPDERAKDLQTRRLKINLCSLPGMSVVELFSPWIWFGMFTFSKCVVRCRGNMNCIQFVPSKWKAHTASIREGFHGKNPHAPPSGGNQRWGLPGWTIPEISCTSGQLSRWGHANSIDMKNNMLSSLGWDM